MYCCRRDNVCVIFWERRLEYNDRSNVIYDWF